VPTDAAPRARVSLPAIVANVRAAGGRVVDLRRDARGHGFAAVCDVLLAETEVDVLADAADLERVNIASDRVRSAGAADIPPQATFGLARGTHPAMALTGTVLGVKPLRAGEGVSYGYIHRAAADTRVALVTGGYGQGIPRSLGSRVSVTIAGQRFGIVGRVAMDVCVVDIGEAPVERGAAVDFFGDPEQGAPSIEEWARESGLTPLEIIAGVGLHSRREHIR
jgi:alanine racemase